LFILEDPDPKERKKLNWKNELELSSIPCSFSNIREYKSNRQNILKKDRSTEVRYMLFEHQKYWHRLWHHIFLSLLLYFYNLHAFQKYTKMKTLILTSKFWYQNIISPKNKQITCCLFKKKHLCNNQLSSISQMQFIRSNDH